MVEKIIYQMLMLAVSKCLGHIPPVTSWW